MKKAIFIVGPTAVGKTSLAVKISQKIPSILISADSIQVYRGADIISGKDHPIDVKIELIDVLDPTQSFNVRDFTRRVRPLVDASRKLPVIVGGTGLYTKALYENIETINVPPDEELRSDLELLTTQELQKKLKELGLGKFNSLNESDRNNPRRLMRAIEVIVNKNDSKEANKPLFNKNEILIIGLETSMDNLRRRINMRVKERISEGAREEAQRLFNEYENLSPQLKVANGYCQIFEFLKGKISWDEAVEQWNTADYQHAKAQMTWFKKDNNIVWFNIDNTLRADIMAKITHEIGL